MSDNNSRLVKIDYLWAILPPLIIVIIVLFVAYKFIDPAPPHHFAISTGRDEGDYQLYGGMYRDILSEDKVKLDVRPSSGAIENLQKLNDPDSDVDAGFVSDGLSSPEESPNLVSLGSLYYEPIWIFYRGKTEITRLNQLQKKSIAIGEEGGGTAILAMRLLKAAGITPENSKYVQIGGAMSKNQLMAGKVDAAFFMATPDDDIIKKLIHNPETRLINLDDAEVYARQYSYLHHLVLPHGALDSKLNLPAHDVNLVAATATLLVRDTLHPALVYLLMKAITKTHNSAGVFEPKKEFPSDKDNSFPLSDEAERFYRSGGRFWQRFLPYWLIKGSR